MVSIIASKRLERRARHATVAATALVVMLKFTPWAFAATASTLQPRAVELPEKPGAQAEAGLSSAPGDPLQPCAGSLLAAASLTIAAAGAAAWRGRPGRSRTAVQAAPAAVVADDVDLGRGSKAAPQAAPACSAPAWRERHWFPVASTLELDPTRPTPVRIDGLDLVVWNVPGQEDAEDGGWRVMLDACPHRLAPLSEGRVEPATGCLQCAYHGWEFDSAGCCAKIPQVEPNAAEKMRANPRSKARTFPSKLGLKLVWVWLGESPPTGEPADIVKGSHLEEEFSVFGSYTRDLPYGYDSLVENLIDVSHVPFAHHGLQGSREDAMPVSMSIPTVRSSEGEGPLLQFTFGDRTMGMTREASFSLRSPFFFYYLGEFASKKTEEYAKFAARRGTDADKNAAFRLNVVCVPVSPGWSRIIILDAAVPGNEGLRGKIPPWVTHLLSNRFLDSDLAFLHYQERKLRLAPNSAADWADAYYMPGDSDRSIGAWRQWLQREGARCVAPDRALPPAAASREELLDRFEQHTTHCRHCRAAMEDLDTWQRVLGVAGVAALALDRLALGPTALWLAAEVLALAGVVAVQIVKQEFRFKDYEHYKT